MASDFLSTVPKISDSSDSESDGNGEKKPDNFAQQVLRAAQRGKIDQLIQLLDLYPELLNVADEDGYTPLHRACYSSHVSCVKELLNRGASVHNVTKDGWTPLHCAAHWNCYEIVALLIHAGAEINARSSGGQTPLHFAAFHGEAPETLSLLLSTPFVDTTIVNSSGDTPGDVAQRKGPHHKLFDVTDDAINVI